MIDSSKPREELDYKDIYPDLNESDQLNVYIQESESFDANDINNNSHSHNNASGGFSMVDALKKPLFRKINKPLIHHPKFSKTLTDYGFQDPLKPCRKQYTPLLTRPFTCDEDIQEMTRKRLKLVEYDMDEQDLLYLKQRNEASLAVGIKLTPEVFEILITLLENEWNSLELKITSKDSKHSSGTHSGEILQLDNGGDAHKYGNDDGIVEGSIYDQKCAICNDSDCENTNAIVFCDGCNIAVHQECYGIAFIPEGQWLCRKCMISKNRDVHCVFCPSTTGAFKQLDSSLWSHVICALWITELYFANPVYMEPIEGIDLIPKNRWKLSCYICKQRNVGACIQCHNKNCFQAYHVTCAKRSGLYMNLTKGVSGAIANKATLRTYCDRHAPLQYYASHRDDVISGIERTRLYFRDLKILKDKNDKILKKKETDNKLNIFKWKTENDTPIPPQKFADILEAKLTELKVMERVVGYDLVDDRQIEDKNNTRKKKKDGNAIASGSVLELMIAPNTSKEEKKIEIRKIAMDICKYWCLKRETKNGAPLIRKNNNMELSSIIYGSNNEDEIDGKLALGKILIEDLDKVLELVRQTVERQQLLLERNEVTFEIMDSVYFPIKELMEDILRKYNILNTVGSGDGGGFDELVTKVQRYEFRENMENFLEELKRICEINSTTKAGNSVASKISKKILRELKLTDWGGLEKEVKRDFKNDKGNISLPFVTTNGLDTKFKDQDVRRNLETEGLSDVESLSEDYEKELRGVVAN